MQKILIVGLILALTAVVSGVDDNDDNRRHPNRRAICRLPPDGGLCDGICPRYYYDYRRGVCRRFDFGCCGGNANNFKTRTECRAVCQNQDD